MITNHRKDRIFIAFLIANDLEGKPDFSQQGILYQDNYGNIYTEDEIIGSEGYAGFVDGYEGRGNRHGAPKGIPKPKKELNTLDLVTQAILETGRKDSVTENISTLYNYQLQYKLGQTAKRDY